MDSASSPASYRPTRERQELLLDLVGAGEPGVHELAQALGVSASTIRRDLAVLERKGQLARTFGGALLRQDVEHTLGDKSHTGLAAKVAIAHRAASLAEEVAGPGDVVVLDAGSTPAEVARVLGRRADLTLVTNGLGPLAALTDAVARVEVLPGRLRHPSGSILGASTIAALTRVSGTLAFLGAEMLDPVLGINCPEDDQAVVKEQIATSCSHVWVVADSRKLSRAARYPYWVPPTAITGLVTDHEAPAAQVAALRAVGWRVVIAEPGLRKA